MEGPSDKRHTQAGKGHRYDTREALRQDKDKWRWLFHRTTHVRTRQWRWKRWQWYQNCTFFL